MAQANQNRLILFQVTPDGNLYDRPVVLYQDTWELHIRPNKSNVTVNAIREVVATPSYVYRDKMAETRHVLINNNVSTQRGTKMTVFVETASMARYNLVATAFYNRNPNVGPLLYDFTTRIPAAGSVLRSSYDDGSDILYLGIDDAQSAEDEEIEDGVYLGYPEGMDSPCTAMVFGIRKRTPEQRNHVIERLANALRLRQQQVREAFEKAY
jgi:hypothetical protein